MINFYAHRSRNDHSYIDNSKKAILHTIDTDYIKGIELDIRFTKDKKIVVYHNPFVIIDGRIKIISDVNWLDLYKSDICQLKDILSILKTDKIIILEIKYKGKFDNNDVHILIDTVKNYPNLNIYLCSFHTKLMKYIKKIYSGKSGIVIGNLINKYKFIYSFDFDLLRYRKSLKVSKKESFIWTINDFDKVKNLINRNRNKVINIITDKAYLLNENHQWHSHFQQ